MSWRTCKQVRTHVWDVVAGLQVEFLAATASLCAGLPQLAACDGDSLSAVGHSELLPETSLTCAGRVQIKTPWFDVYKQELFRMLMFGDHETFDYPVACEQCFGT